MKVLFVLPNVRVGGVERVRLALIEQFVADGIKCVLALRHCRGELLVRAKALAPVYELAPRGIHQFVPALARLIRREQPTHVITAFPDVAVLAWVAMRMANSHARWVHSVHHTHSSVGSREGRWGWIRFRVEKLLARFVYRRADTVVTVSEGLRLEVLDSFSAKASRVITIHNPTVPDDQLHEVGRRRTDTSNPCRIVAVGRLVRAKGFDVLLRAMALVPGRWQLDIWGEGTEYSNLERLVFDRGLCGRVHLRGYTSDPFAVMRSADVFVLSSRNEGLPGVLIEALACQCQIVATDCPQGPREILVDGTLGQLVASEDPRALADAIVRAIDGSFRVEPNRLLARARDFSRSVCCARWEALLAEVMANCNRGWRGRDQ